MLIKLKRGFDVPITGAPEQIIHPSPPLSSVALIGADYIDLKHSMSVNEGDMVRLGQTLFTDRKHSEIRYTAPGTGRVRAINRGAQRRLASVIIDLDGDQAESFPAYPAEELARLAPGTVKVALLRSGLWTAFRARPYGRVPSPDKLPHTLLVTAIDTNPLAADPTVIIAEHPEDFRQGLVALNRLATHRTYLCRSPGAITPAPTEGIVIAEFQGPHPAGLPGTHMHYLMDGTSEAAWHVSYQDVIAIGKLFLTGRIWSERIVALGGPGIKRPRLLRARLGASLDELIADERKPEYRDCRVISGSVLSGRRASPMVAHLGRYHQQVTVLPEATNQRTLSNLLARLGGRSRWSAAMDTALNGWPAGMLPVEAFERVWPLRMPPAPLLRALLVRDEETAQALGCLGLEEEDLALCTYVCPAKYDYGSALRATLKAIERSA